MSNFEKIKDTVLTYADRYAKAFAAGAPIKSGRLKNSYRGVAKLDSENRFSIQIFGEFYGPFQSYGVRGSKGGTTISVPPGVNPPPLNGSFYSFKDKMPPWSPRTQLPFPAALKVYEQGIHPSNYMGNAINNVTPDFIKALDEAGVKDVEDFLKGLSKIEVK
jgi:hypothetical protein